MAVEALHTLHRPGEQRERQRIEAAGGWVTQDGGVWRVNGQLAVSRAIGDLHLRPWVIPEAEMTPWISLMHKVPGVNEQGTSRKRSSRDRQGLQETYLVVATDGVFEQLGLHEVCLIVQSVIEGQGKELLQVIGDSAGVVALGPSAVADSRGSGAQQPIKSHPSSSVNVCKSSDNNVGKAGHTQQGHRIGKLGGKGRENVKNLALEQAQRETVPLQAVADAIVDAAIASGSSDNVAVVVTALGALTGQLQAIDSKGSIEGTIPCDDVQYKLSGRSVADVRGNKTGQIRARPALAALSLCGREQEMLRHEQDQGARGESLLSVAVRFAWAALRQLHGLTEISVQVRRTFFCQM